MKNNKEVLRELYDERFGLVRKINKLQDFKYYRNEEFIKLGSMMCQMLDTQIEIMNSYFEILTMRIMYLEEKINDKD